MTGDSSYLEKQGFLPPGESEVLSLLCSIQVVDFKKDYRVQLWEAFTPTLKAKSLCCGEWNERNILDVSMDNLMLLTVYFFFWCSGNEKGKNGFIGFCLFVPNRDSIIFVPAEMYHFVSYIRLKAACHPVLQHSRTPDFIGLLFVFLIESQFLEIRRDRKWGHKKNDLSNLIKIVTHLTQIAFLFLFLSQTHTQKFI